MPRSRPASATPRRSTPVSETSIERWSRTASSVTRSSREWERSGGRTDHGGPKAGARYLGIQGPGPGRRESAAAADSYQAGRRARALRAPRSRTLQKETTMQTRWMTTLAALTLVTLAACQLRADAIDKVIPAPALDTPAAEAAGPQTAVLAGGCFWGVQGMFEHVQGV